MMHKSGRWPIIYQISLMVFIIILLSGIASGVIQSDSEVSLTEGVVAYNSGDLEYSLQIFELIVQKDPLWPNGWLWKGEVLSDLGRQDEADIAFKTGRCLQNPGSCQVPLEENTVKNAGFNGHHAGNTYSSPSVEDPVPEFISGHGDPISHDVSLSPSNSISPDNNQNPAESYEKQGDYSFDRSEWDKALQFYKMAEKLDPDNPDYSDKEGEAHAKKGDLISALSAWNRTLEHESNQTLRDELFQKRSEAFSNLNQSLEAAKELENMSPASRNPQNLIRKGDLYSMVGDLPSAEKAYLDSLSLLPGDVDTSLSLAKLRIQQGRYPDAKDILNSIPEISLTPPQSRFLNQLKKQVPHDSTETSDNLSVLFSRPEFYILTLIGFGVVFYLRKKIF